MRNRVRGLRLGTKLAALISLLIGGIALFVYLFFPARLERQAMRSVAGKAEAIGRMTAFGVAPALLFGDRAGVHEALAGAVHTTDLVYVIVIDGEGRKIASVTGVGHADRVYPRDLPDPERRPARRHAAPRALARGAAQRAGARAARRR